MGKRSGFTLIELLVVIAIIAVLAAILFPVFARAKEQARQTQCLNNCKQIGNAFAMYLQDNDGYYPICWENAASGVGDSAAEYYAGHGGVDNANLQTYLKLASYRAQLDTYAKNSGIWKCPSDAGCKTDWSTGSRFTSYHYRFFLAANYAPGSNGTYHAYHRTWSESDFDYPAGVYILHEMWPWHDNRTTTTAHWANGQTVIAPDAKMTFVFGDYHAKIVNIDKLVNEVSTWPGMGYDYHWPHGGWGTDSVRPYDTTTN